MMNGRTFIFQASTQALYKAISLRRSIETHWPDWNTGDMQPDFDDWTLLATADFAEGLRNRISTAGQMDEASAQKALDSEWCGEGGELRLM